MSSFCLFWQHTGRRALARFVVWCAAIFCLPWIASAGEVALRSTGNGQWQLIVSELHNVQALDLLLRYDAQRLPGLTVTAEEVGDAMVALNDNPPGLIRLGVVSTQPLPAGGVLLRLQSSSGAGELVVMQFTGKGSDAEGKPVPIIFRPLQPSSAPPPTHAPPVVRDPVSNPVESAPLHRPPVIAPRAGQPLLGRTLLPEDRPAPLEGARGKLPPPPTPGVSVAVGENNPSLKIVPAAPTLPEKRFHSQEEIVAAIERLPRPWTVEAVKGIFLQPPSSSHVRQLPPVALADGQSKIYLYLSKGLSKGKPGIGIQGCTLGDTWDAGADGWQLELITRPGIWPATALLLGEGDLLQFPVVIVPPLDILPVDDPAAIPLFDFDQDGSVNAVDAFVYVGNLLAREKSSQ